MPGEVNIVVHDTVADMKRAVDSLRKAIMARDLARSVGRSLTDSTLKTVVKFTPRAKYRHDAYSSRRGGQPIAGDWGAQVLSSVKNQQFRALVSNAAGNTEDGQTILLALEGGAKPHKMPATGVRDKPYIFAAESSRLKFMGRSTSLNGIVFDRIQKRKTGRGLVKADAINHPGHRPFRMVARTIAAMDPVAASLSLRIAQEIESLWSASASVGATRA